MLYEKLMIWLGYKKYKCCGQFGPLPINYDTCSKCGKLTCFKCRGWINLSRLCPQCFDKLTGGTDDSN
ncbi:MAG: hypothetical protein BWY02_02559 [bacterium ADurb.Bin157]|nr:MAG: hypothetical protein BWY02_02559 [bacterium ADurb.Bin157]